MHLRQNNEHSEQLKGVCVILFIASHVGFFWLSVLPASLHFKSVLQVNLRYSYTRQLNRFAVNNIWPFPFFLSEYYSLANDNHKQKMLNTSN